MKITKIDENTVEGITQCTPPPPPPPPFYWCMRVGGGGGIKHPTKFLKKKRVLGRISIFRGGC